MLAKRIIPCLDVKNNQVVKGVRFREHQVMGDIIEFSQCYSDQGADELVFYDITASADGRTVDCDWVSRVAREINIPFCVAGGIRDVKTAGEILAAGADKISINSPAIENPNLINELVDTFGSQCIVIGIDSHQEGDEFFVYQYTGDERATIKTKLHTHQWVNEVQQRGAGEIVLNCMNQDGARDGYDIAQLRAIRDICNIPLIASGGAGNAQHFCDVFTQANVDGALAASVFHKNILQIPELKTFLQKNHIEVRV